MSQRFYLLMLVCFLAAIGSSGAQASSSCMPDESTASGESSQILFERSYDSGARWSMCVSIDDQSGLMVGQVHYGAPLNELTKVLDSASIAQILFKYDEDTAAQHWLSTHGLGAANQLPVTAERCPDGQIQAVTDNVSMCVREQNLHALTSLRNSESHRRRAVSLHAWSAIDGFVVEQVWEFSEDGLISPMVRLGGVLSRFSGNDNYSSDIALEQRASHATYVSTWKLDFNIGNTPDNDIVEAMAFIPHQSTALRRVINVTPITTESLHKVNREQFKGWLIRDRDVSSGPDRDTRIGYYLDPQVSGFAYASRTDNWSVFDFAVSAARECEKLASGNARHQPDCGDSLDDYVNGESVQNTDTVVWFSTARQFLPKKEDYPALLMRESRFTLMPFDWTASTPFTPVIE